MKENKREIFTAKEDVKSNRNIWVYVAIGVVVIALIIILVAKPKDKTPVSTAEEVILTEEEKLDQEIGPYDVEDRGKWFNPDEYYSIFNEDGVPSQQLDTAMFGTGDLKGIVPSGVTIEPILLTYDDYKPFKSNGEFGYMDSYATNNIEPFEVQLGVIKDSLSLLGGYSVKTYTGNIKLDLSNIEYYTVNTYETTETDEHKAYDGYLEPYFNFDYSGSFTASNQGKTKKSTFSGSLSDGTWYFTNNLSGQDNSVFNIGSVLMRCKLPCKVTDESNKTTNSYINLYFKVSQVRIGTRQDVHP